MKFNKSIVLGALALVLTACTPSVNLQLAIPRPSAPEFSVDLKASANTGAVPLPVVFTAATPERATYAWFINDRKVGGKRSTLTYTFKEAGSYEVTVAATNAAGDATTDSGIIEVLDEENVTVEEL